MWLFMAWLIPWTQTFTWPSPSNPVPWCQHSHLLFFNAWFIIVKSLLILLQSPSWLTRLLRTFNKLTLIILYYIDVDEYVFISWIYSKIKIDMKYKWSILCYSFFSRWNSFCYMAFKVSNQISHNICLEERITSI
jgi:hypothetical protein